MIDYVFHEKEFEPVTEAERANYKLDYTFVYDAFQNCWADFMNFYLVEHNKPTKSGRNVYLDAVGYFRGTML